ncbi:unnamed protein product, partial [Chrysoparadoxa australica]
MAWRNRIPQARKRGLVTLGRSSQPHGSPKGPWSCRGTLAGNDSMRSVTRSWTKERAVLAAPCCNSHGKARDISSAATEGPVPGGEEWKRVGTLLHKLRTLRNVKQAVEELKK